MEQKKKKDIKSKCNRLYVVAIDFGTTYSGYAFSWKSDWRKVHTETFNSGQFVSSKASTTLLLNPDKKFLAFGYAAENIFMEMTTENDSDSDSDSESKEEKEKKTNKNLREHYYFHRFKMLLHEDETLHRNSEIKDIFGKPMKALDVFSISIEHLKNKLMVEMNKRLTGDILEKDVDFVLTVPAIWGDAAKMFMREAAVQAGIKTDQLTLALEPEAASIYCQFCHPSSEDNSNSTPVHYDAFRQLVEEKRKYMVVDLGGGTVDITVHKQTDDYTLEEIIPATGGPMGGTTVDRAFETFLETIGGKGTLQTFKNSYMEDYLLLIREFEAKKRAGNNTKVRITVPLSFETLVKKKRGVKNLSTVLEKSQYKGLVNYKNKKLMFDEPTVFKSFFNQAINGVIHCIKDILKEKSCADLSDIIMVGGFSESELIQKSLREEFPSKRFLIPDDPGLAVLKGAVYFGHIPNAISKRVARYTYGVQICPKFMPGDPESRKIFLGGSDRCMGVLHPIIRRGDRIEAGMEYPHSFYALKNSDGKFKCGFYVSDKKEPKFVDDKDCRLLGTLTVEIPKTKQENPPEIEETFILGETELRFRAKLLGSGQPKECPPFDMLDASKLPGKTNLKNES